MKTQRMSACLRFHVIFWSVAAWLSLASDSLYAHKPGEILISPTKAVSLTPPLNPDVNGTIDVGGAETIWGLPQTAIGLVNSCAEIGMPASNVKFYAVNGDGHLFLAFEIPDNTANASDRLFLFFDSDHSAGTALGANDQAFELGFTNIMANNTDVDFKSYVVSMGATEWPCTLIGTTCTPTPTSTTLPATWRLRYTRHPNKWEVELKIPLAELSITLLPGAETPVGFAFAYLNRTGLPATPPPGGGDCLNTGVTTDFAAVWPSGLISAFGGNLPTIVNDRSLWGNLMVGMEAPIVGFNDPGCCFSNDIQFLPHLPPFNVAEAVNFFARVKNFHASSPAPKVNVEVSLHGFGTGGAPIAGFPATTHVLNIAPGTMALSAAVPWTVPASFAGQHGCVQAVILPPDVDKPYVAQGGASLAQYNINVNCMPQGLSGKFKFLVYNALADPQPLKMMLIKQELLPPGFEKTEFSRLPQLPRPLQPKEEIEAELTVTVPRNMPITQLPAENVQVSPTAGGTAPPLKFPTGAAPVFVNVRTGDRLHVTATGSVDLDGNGPLKSNGPQGQDLTNNSRRGFPYLLEGERASLFAGALIASFNSFRTSFVAGSELTLTVPPGVEGFWLAINDQDSSFSNNTGAGFKVMITQLQDPLVAAGDTSTAQATPVTIPQVNITAASSARVTVGDGTVYNLLTTHGGVTYQFLITEAEARGPVCPCGQASAASYALSSSLMILGLLFIRRRVRRKTKNE